MKTIYVTDLLKGQIIDNETFVITECEEMKDKNSNSYFNLVLADKTGRIQAKIWNDTLLKVDRGCLKVEKVVRISAKVEEFKAKLQLNIFEIEEVDESQLDEYLESSEFNPNELFKDIESVYKSFKDKSLVKLLDNIFSDSEVKRRYIYWPAASSVHHDFRSGLIQHVCEMLEIAKSLNKYYQNCDFEILKTGIILHDIGKIYELDANGISTSYSAQGTLIGHIVLGIQLLDTFKASEILNKSKYNHLVHLIASHHGLMEYGSPVLPSTVEAIMLSNIDNLSSKSRTALKSKKNISNGQEFSPNIPWLEGAKIWKGEIVDLEDQLTLN